MKCLTGLIAVVFHERTVHSQEYIQFHVHVSCCICELYSCVVATTQQLPHSLSDVQPLKLAFHAGMMPGQQYMPPPQMQHQQHMMPQLHTQQPMGGGAWYPPPVAGAQGVPPGLQGQHQAGPFQNVPVQPVTGTQLTFVPGGRSTNC